MNRVIAELLDDPVTQRLMLADQVDQRALAADLRKVAWRLAGAEGAVAASGPQVGHRRVVPPSTVDVAATTKAAASACGALRS